jgi:hypothetical protein
MIRIIITILFCVFGTAYAQQYTDIFGKQNFKDTIKLSKYHDATGDSCLAVDASGKVVQRVRGSGGGGLGWSLTGNAGTSAGTNFIGTTDGQDLILKSNNTILGTVGGRLFGSTNAIAFGDFSHYSDSPFDVVGLNLDLSNNLFLFGDPANYLGNGQHGIISYLGQTSIYGDNGIALNSSDSVILILAPLATGSSTDSALTIDVLGRVHKRGLGGATPNLDEVTSAGSGTSNSIIVGGLSTSYLQNMTYTILGNENINDNDYTVTNTPSSTIYNYITPLTSVRNLILPEANAVNSATIIIIKSSNAVNASNYIHITASSSTIDFNSSYDINTSKGSIILASNEALNTWSIISEKF